MNHEQFYDLIIAIVRQASMDIDLAHRHGQRALAGSKTATRQTNAKKHDNLFRSLEEFFETDDFTLFADTFNRDEVERVEDDLLARYGRLRDFNVRHRDTLKHLAWGHASALNWRATPPVKVLLTGAGGGGCHAANGLPSDRALILKT